METEKSSPKIFLLSLVCPRQQIGKVKKCRWGEKRENLYASYAAEESFRAETVMRERERKKNRAAREIDTEVSSVHKMSIFHAKEMDKPSW